MLDDLQVPGPYPRRSGNLVTPWIDGVPFYHRLAAACRQARARIWAIVSFIEPGFHFPDGTPWWALLAEAEARGVDVRVLFWRNPGFFKTAHVFLGDARERELLRSWGARWAARWDSSGEDPHHCHHQKAYVIDGLEAEPIAFVGGMVLSHATLAEPGHHRGYQKHDAFLELRGPAVADVEHNFVQRWNLARQDPAAPPWPDGERAGPLPHPDRLPPRCGEVEVQLARTLRPGCYPGLTQAVGAEAFDGSAGEVTILAHYRAAFSGARRSVYIENQHPGQHELLQLLDAALARGVEVLMIVPGEPMAAIYAARAEVEVLAARGRAHEHRYGPTFLALAALGRHPNFTLAALARGEQEIYTHAKLCIVDGEWLTLGSANFVDLSLDADHSELNAAVWGADTALPLLRTLCAEHGDEDFSGCDDRQAVARLAALARASRDSLEAGGPMVCGCRALDPARYALRDGVAGR